MKRLKQQFDAAGLMGFHRWIEDKQEHIYCLASKNAKDEIFAWINGEWQRFY
jgi:hypothetical protein